MTAVLGRKQRISHEDFLAAWDQIEELVPRDAFDRKFRAAVARLDRYAALARGRIAYAWSGGKDSIALQAVCEAAGIERCVYGMTTGLEYSQFLQWVTANMPDQLTVLDNGWDLEWLASHQDMLFPQNATVAAKWFKGIQHWAQARYYREHDLRMIALGRRWADGNYTGRGGKEICYTAKGITRLSPIADWTHEDVLALLHYHGWGDNLPPFYRWPRGYRCGTHAWPARQWTDSIEHGYAEVFQIEPDLIRRAAERIPSAARFLESV